MTKIKNNYSLKLLLLEIKYTIALKKYKKSILKLNLKDRINAIFNSYPNQQIARIIENKAYEQDTKIYSLIEDEIRRLNSLTKSYGDGPIEKMTFKEMEAIINYYADDVWTQKKIKQNLNILFKKNNKKLSKTKGEITRFKN
ncbi:MAG: hypothetical protein IKF19_00400 [Bacilli bacterium]|nr:hypothetical protein [Bacilli bacterium]